MTNTTIVDWVLIQLRDATDNTIGLEQHAGFLLNNGNMVDVTASAGIVFNQHNGIYYMAIIHRNHLDVMSLSQETTVAGELYFDFTTPNNQVFGTNAQHEVAPGVWGMVCGDVNGDGKILYSGGCSDLFQILQTVGPTTINTPSNTYTASDANLSNSAIYSGGGSDAVIILQQVGPNTINTPVFGFLPQ